MTEIEELKCTRAKHTEKSTQKPSATELSELLEKTRLKIFENKGYPSDIRNVFSAEIKCKTEILLQKLHIIWDDCQERNGADAFYSAFHHKIIDNAKEYFELDFHLAGLVAVKLRDILFCYYSSSEDKPLPNPKPIKEEEKDGLQKLAGYVIRKLKICATRSTKTPPGVLDILQSMVTDATDQKFIRVQSRGGLTAATVEVNKLILIAEELFRANTSSGLQLVQINSMIEQLVSNGEVISTFNEIADKAGQSSMENDLKNSILLTMFKLFLRVWAFSLSRDIIAK